MAWARKSRYLICFYCGTKSQIKYDGTTRQFGCKSCGSTNYLDENGDIADPPTATEFEAPAARFTVSSQQATSPDSIWCATCLKNQRLYTASLAQYLPDDPSHPDYAELERNYYRFRKSLEQRYPQVCAACAEKADARIRQAGYVAKTDHLRRMMDRTRGRKAARTTTPLDWVNSVGRWLWWGGLAVQMLWHVRVAMEVLEHGSNGLSDPDDEGWSAVLFTGFKRVVDALPAANRLIMTTIVTSILSVWWNPHFVQANRGFTRHLLGFTQWYSFQGLIIFFRFIFRNVLNMDGGRIQKPEAKLGAHLVMAGLMTIIYVAASRSIKVDTTPLFKSTTVPVQVEAAKASPRPAEDYSTSLSHALNEIDSPTPGARSSALNMSPVTTFDSPILTRRQPITPAKSQDGFGGLRLSDPQTPTDAGDVEEMDWVPTTSQHRAFSAVSPSRPTTRAFDEAPPLPESNKPFWYRFPATTASPGQRRDNPRAAPYFMSKSEKKEEARTGPLFGTNSANLQVKAEEKPDTGVVFKQPQFFAPERDADEANSLADLLNQSFSLGQVQDDDTASEQRMSTERTPNTSTQSRNVTSARAVTTAILLAIWLLASVSPFPYRTEGQLLVLGLAGVIALNATGDTTRYERGNHAVGAAAYSDQALGVAELAALCWVGWQTWARAGGVGMYGSIALATMMGHQLWNAVR